MANKKTEKKAEVLSALESCGGNITAACRSVGITKATYYNWRKNDAEFAESAAKVDAGKRKVKIGGGGAKTESGKECSQSREAAALAGSLKRIISLLREQGKYSGELEIQAELTARLIQRFNDIDQEMHSPDYDILNVEISREGNSRSSVNPLEKLYLEYYDRIHRALRALGMNVDSKERKSDNDDFLEKMEDFNRRYDD